MTRRLAREEGLLVGISSGANARRRAEAARRREPRSAGCAASTVQRSGDDLSDGGERYLSERFWSEVQS